MFSLSIIKVQEFQHKETDSMVEMLEILDLDTLIWDLLIHQYRIAEN